MNTWAQSGKQCVCINDNWDDGMARAMDCSVPTRVPMIDEVLTISEVIGEVDYPLVAALKGRVALAFHELEHDYLFSITHFRPLMNQDDDVETFRSIVKTEEEKVR